MKVSAFNPYDHFGFLTNRVARLIVRTLEPSMANDGHHFPISCIGILAELWSKDGLNQKELGISLVKNKSSINKMLKALEKENLVVKKESPHDGREKLIYLTDKGREMQFIIENKGKEMEAMLLRDCSQNEIKTAKIVLERMYKKLHKSVEEYSEPLIYPVNSKS